MSVLETVLRFVKCINAHDVDGLCALMSDDHLFVDSVNAQFQGREVMRQGWIGYFGLMPDYTISITNSMVDGDVVALFGMTEGTYAVKGELRPENHWQGPAAWKAIVKDGMLTHWQVYADNEPVRKIMDANP
jgi:ketosteroid isomerase-like protein